MVLGTDCAEGVIKAREGREARLYTYTVTRRGTFALILLGICLSVWLKIWWGLVLCLVFLALWIIDLYRDLPE